MTDAATPSPAPDDDPLVISGDDFRDQFGEDLTNTLDLSTWQQGADLAGLNHRLQAEVADAVAQERDAIAFIRREVSLGWRNSRTPRPQPASTRRPPS